MAIPWPKTLASKFKLSAIAKPAASSEALFILNPEDILTKDSPNSLLFLPNCLQGRYIIFNTKAAQG